MQKPSELYMISEPEASAAANVVPIASSAAASPPRPREHSWRELMRSLQKSQAAHKPLP